MSQMPMHPLLVGLAAALGGSMVGAFLLTVFGFSGPVESIFHLISGTASVALYGFLISLPGVIFYGMPLYEILKHFDAANKITAIFLGGLPGVIFVQWTHGSWLDPVLWNGVIIAVLYVLLRKRYASS